MTDVKKLIAMGYCRISNNYRTVARIDRADWLDVAYQTKLNHVPLVGKAVRDFYEGKDLNGSFCLETILIEAKMVADHYRRCLTKDTIELLPEEIYKQFPPSSHNETGYLK